jgi:hypothetical protein
MKALFTLWVIAAFIVPSRLIGIASDHKTACPQKKGHTYICAKYETYHSDEFWNSSGKKRDAHNEFEKVEYKFYAEYGLSNRDTFSLNSAWGRVDESVNGRLFGFEELEIGWKHYWGTKWCHYVSTELVGIFPLETEYKPGLRYGEYGGEFNLLLTKGLKFWKRCGSYDLRLGYRAYTGFPSDQIRADATFNLIPMSRVLLSAGGYLEYGLFNGHSKEDESLFDLNPNYRLFRVQVQGAVSVYKGASVFVGCQRHLWGRNVGTKGGYYAGLQIQF